MKPSNLIIVAIAVILPEMNYSQMHKDTSIIDRLYIKAGYEIANYSNATSFTYSYASPKGQAQYFTAAIAYDFNRILQFEISYKHMYSISYNDGIENFKPWGRFYYDASGSLESFLLNLRANYFVNVNRRVNPIYFTGSLYLGYQKVLSSEVYTYDTYSETVNKTHNRFITGPEAGFGIYWDLGIINFQTEFSFSVRYAPLRGEKRFTENSVNFNISPVLNY